ncbi:hypothetical protein SDC9_110462 [bioreactor metagenome]|uniref:Uncharacterized protein n=1 Tax=bioreactor metagenome TaxID=1076179 RepID=A0A645BG34_9ZZZZ
MQFPKPATVRGFIAASVPPHIIASAYPPVIALYASPIADVELAQAVQTEIHPLFA